MPYSVGPTRHPTRDGPNGQVNVVIPVNAPHTRAIPPGACTTTGPLVSSSPLTHPQVALAQTCYAILCAGDSATP